MELTEAQRQIESRQREEDRAFREDALRHFGRVYIESLMRWSGMPGWVEDETP